MLKNNDADLMHLVEECSEAAVKNDAYNKLVNAINFLINHHFEKLVQLLYRKDVDEKKLNKHYIKIKTQMQV